MKSVYGYFLLIFFLPFIAEASHLRGGEILAKQVSGQTYTITVRLYMDARNGQGAINAANSVQVCFGDGQTREFPRTRTENINNSTIVVVDFVQNYTFSSAGIFQISVAADNRTGQMLNLPGSIDTPMFIWTVVNTHVPNTTPILPYLSLDAGVRQLFTSDLKPTVADPDSISVRTYRLSRPSPGTCGVRMPDHSYVFPNEVSSSGTFKVEPALKQLVWKAPQSTGLYVFALLVTEWRDGVKISESYREGTISVTDKPGETVEIPPYESSEFSGVITSVPKINSPEITMAVEAYPVPTDTYVTVKAYSKERAIIRLKLIDSKGRIVNEIATKNPELAVQEVFDMTSLPSGIYVIRAENAKDSVSQKVIR